MGGYSFSKIDMFMRCPSAYKMRYIDNITVPPNRYMLIGKAAHEAVAEYMEYLRDTEQLKDLKEWEKIKKRYYAENPWFADDLKEILDSANDLILPPEVCPEIEFSIRIDENGEILDNDNRDYFFIGVVDLAYMKDNKIVIIDWKTSRTDQYTNPNQIKVYAWLMSHLYPEVQSYIVSFHYLRTGKEQKEEITAHEIREFEDWIKGVIARIESETKFKANPGDGCSLCDYILYCPVLRYSLEQKVIKTETEEDVKRAAKMLWVMEQACEKLRYDLKKWVEIHGDIHFDNISLGYSSHQKVEFSTKQKMELAQYLLKHGLTEEEMWEVFSVSKTSVKTGLYKTNKENLLDNALSLGTKQPFEKFDFTTISS